MKNIVITLVLIGFVSCLGGVNSDSSAPISKQSDSIANAELKAGGKMTITDEYWPFKNTVKYSDPYLLDVVNELESVR